MTTTMKKRRKVAAHGTPAGYQRHYRIGEKPCTKCRKAWNAYVRERPNRDPLYKTRAKVYQKARNNAFQELRDMYPDVYQALYEKHFHMLKKEAKLP